MPRFQLWAQYIFCLFLFLFFFFKNFYWIELAASSVSLKLPGDERSLRCFNVGFKGGGEEKDCLSEEVRKCDRAGNSEPAMTLSVINSPLPLCQAELNSSYFPPAGAFI